MSVRRLMIVHLRAFNHDLLPPTCQTTGKRSFVLRVLSSFWEEVLCVSP